MTANVFTVTEDKVIGTSCLKCVFAEFEPADPHGATQTQSGCKLDRIKKFARHTTVREENGHFFIEGRICNTFRFEDSGWTDKFPTDQIEQVYKEVSVTFDAIIIVESLADFEASVHELEWFSHIPIQVQFVNNADLKASQLVSYLRQSRLSQLTTWRVIDIHPDRKGLSYDACVEEAIPNVKGRYYMVGKAGHIIPRTYLEKINYKLVRDLERFCLVEPADYPHLLVVFTEVHRHPVIVGNHECTFGNEQKQVILKNVLEKVKFLAEEDGKSYLIKQEGEFC